MNASNHGSKHACPECATKYYDLRKDDVVCPRCGANPPAAKVRKVAARKTGHSIFGRYP